MSTNAPRVIKRYANRKLYDTQESRYVTLEQISEMIRRGDEVRIVDNATKEDLTSVTLAQIIFEEEKRQRSFLPLSLLRKIIQSGGESFHDIMAQLQESAGRVGRVFRKDDDIDGEEGAGAESEPADPAEVGGDADLSKNEPTRMIRDFLDTVHNTIDEWQKRVDANVHSAISSVSNPLAPLQKEVQTLRDRIREMEQKLRSFSLRSQPGSEAKPVEGEEKKTAPAETTTDTPTH